MCWRKALQELKLSFVGVQNPEARLPTPLDFFPCTPLLPSFPTSVESRIPRSHTQSWHGIAQTIKIRRELIAIFSTHIGAAIRFTCIQRPAVRVDWTRPDTSWWIARCHVRVHVASMSHIRFMSTKTSWEFEHAIQACRVTTSLVLYVGVARHIFFL